MLMTDAHHPDFFEVVPPDQHLEEVAANMLFAEGPVWNPRNSTLYWVDILDDSIWQRNADGVQDKLLEPSGRANGMTLDQHYRLVVAGWSSRTIWQMDLDSGATDDLVASYDGQKLNTPNDIVIGSDESIYWTEPSGGLFIPGMAGTDVQRYRDGHPVLRHVPQGDTTEVVISDLAYPNGLAFSPDESILYVADTWQKSVVAFDVDGSGAVSPRGSDFYMLYGDEEGVADGMKVDIAGNVYVTGPAGIHVISPTGELLGRVLFGDEHCTNMAWGDSDLKTLYVTTLHKVLSMRVLVAGVPVVKGRGGQS